MTEKTVTLCASCKEPSPLRKYCEQCVSDLSIPARENPAHGKAARVNDDEPQADDELRPAVLVSMLLRT